MKHVHVTGCGRSGTTLLVEMMRSSFKCGEDSAHERSILSPPPANPSVYISKCPGEVGLLAPLLEADNDLYGVHIYRDPRSVICSIHGKATESYATNFPSWKRAQVAAGSLRWHPRFLEIRYEQLIENPDGIQQDIERACPFLERRGCFSSYHENARPSEDAVQALNGFRRVDPGRMDSWKNHLPRVKEQLGRHPEMVDMLVALGYENDDTWTIQLSDVASGHFRAWEDERTNPFKKFDRWQRKKRRLHKRLTLLRRKGTTSGLP